MDLLSIAVYVVLGGALVWGLYAMAARRERAQGHQVAMHHSAATGGPHFRMAVAATARVVEVMAVAMVAEEIECVYGPCSSVFFSPWRWSIL